jgi:hypothetical protein
LATVGCPCRVLHCTVTLKTHWEPRRCNTIFGVGVSAPQWRASVSTASPGLSVSWRRLRSAPLLSLNRPRPRVCCLGRLCKFDPHPFHCVWIDVGRSCLNAVNHGGYASLACTFPPFLRYGVLESLNQRLVFEKRNDSHLCVHSNPPMAGHRVILLAKCDSYCGSLRLSANSLVF